MPEESSSTLNTPQIVQTDPPGALRRSHQVKVTLNTLELGFLDEIVAHMGSDRSSVFRHLLRLASGGSLIEADQFPTEQSGPSAELAPQITKINLGSLSGSKENTLTVIIHEPQEFDDVTVALQDLSVGNIITVNLCMMEPAQAQRFVDFVAGGTFTIKGNQERLGDSVFLFTPKEVTVKHAAKTSEATPKQKQPGETLLLDGSKSAEPNESESLISKPGENLLIAPE